MTDLHSTLHFALMYKAEIKQVVKLKVIRYKVKNDHILLSWFSVLYVFLYFCFLLSICSLHVTQAPGFHVVSHTQKTPKPIVPKEKSYSSSRKNQKASSSAGESSLYPESTS